MLHRIEQYYEAILALWNQLYINMKSLVSWHYCMIDIEKIRAMTIAKVCPLGPPRPPGGGATLLPDLLEVPQGSAREAAQSPMEVLLRLIRNSHVAGYETDHSYATHQ